MEQEDFSHWPTISPLSEPLSFTFKKTTITPTTTTTTSTGTCTTDSESESENTPIVKFNCLLCNHFETESRFILEHLFHQHQFVIADVNHVANLSSYLDHWKKQMNGKDLKEYTTVIQTQPTQSQPVTDYYLLSDILPEDQDLRRKLQIERLNFVLNQQHLERINPDFSSVCPMCPVVFKGDRSAVSAHLLDQHNFNIGLSDNLVNINELLDIIREKTIENQCLFCEKTFKSPSVLKLHMKKKKHTRLNPLNTVYDRFYLLNYLEPGKSWEDLKKEDEEDNDNQLNNVELMQQAQNELNGQHHITHWDDWTENSDEDAYMDESAVCLFCTEQFENSDIAFDHMNVIHSFNFDQIRKEWKLDYYDSMKVLNFIRRQIYQLVCCYCGHQFQDANSLYAHLAADTQHCGVKKNNPKWADPQYLFPTYENDSILRNFEGFDEEENNQYLNEEKEYQSQLMDEMIQTRAELMQRITNQE
ncbi:hypothetical protein CYY_000070 [Polysphondylium violaceum]|uniref:C2H2-type domain-containing protein n=1 Tax=Polysphondylium violaceum TaxID=133409 RepID=A0A8J4V2P3_9MYCE|nr:hypothetical protein CYY_000070 [Polysphondylium violaceum]